MGIFGDIIRPIALIVLVLLIPYVYFVVRTIIWELRDIGETMHETLRVTKEIRDHQKGIKKKKVKSE